MRVIAPGKLLLTGAYVVMEGAPAIVVAIDRYAVADTRAVDPRPSPEVRVAFREGGAPRVDVCELQAASGRKLGLGSSAAGLVAALGVRALASGADIRDATVREEMLGTARRAHATAQRGGSGVDVAASVYGGVLQYRLPRDAAAMVRRLDWPESLVFATYDSGESSRTSDLLTTVGRHRSLPHIVALYDRLADLAEHAVSAFEVGDLPRFIETARAYGDRLGELGRGTDAPIVPPRFDELSRLAAAEGAAFIPSGAGGGDVAVWLSLADPSPEFSSRASTLSMRRLSLSIDRGGVRPASF
jgi:phosphomevalonate kinase